MMGSCSNGMMSVSKTDGGSSILSGPATSMKVLVACECSGRVREAFRRRGHDAWSCDIKPSEDDSPHHIQGDVLDIMGWGWDMMIAHPPCTYLSYAGTRHWNNPGRAELREEALGFFLRLYNAEIEKVCVENPVGYMNTVFRKPDQIIHPYYWGGTDLKRTCLWLKGLPLLTYEHRDKPAPLYRLSTGKCVYFTDDTKNPTDRSRTFSQIAEAMASQWG